MSTLSERYGDILPDPRDNAALRAVSDLDMVYTHDVSPSPDLGVAMDHALYTYLMQTERTLSPLSRRWATRRPLIGIVALIAALATVAGVYAAVTTLGDQTLLANNGTRQIAAANLGRPLNLSRHACGFTVTLNRVYADVQRTGWPHVLRLRWRGNGRSHARHGAWRPIRVGRSRGPRNRPRCRHGSRLRAYPLLRRPHRFGSRRPAALPSGTRPVGPAAHYPRYPTGGVRS